MDSDQLVLPNEIINSLSGNDLKAYCQIAQIIGSTGSGWLPDRNKLAETLGISSRTLTSTLRQLHDTLNPLGYFTILNLWNGKGTKQRYRVVMKTKFIVEQTHELVEMKEITPGENGEMTLHNIHTVKYDEKFPPYLNKLHLSTTNKDRKGRTLSCFSLEQIHKECGSPSVEDLQTAILETEAYRPKKGITDILAYIKSRFVDGKLNADRIGKNGERRRRKENYGPIVRSKSELDDIRRALNEHGWIERGIIPVRVLDYLDNVICVLESHPDELETYIRLQLNATIKPTEANPWHVKFFQSTPSRESKRGSKISTVEGTVLSIMSQVESKKS